MSEAIIYEGLVEDLSFEEYKAAPGVNNSLLSHGYRSWRHAQAYSQGLLETEETAVKRIGKIVHSASLEPERLDIDYVIIPEDAPKRPSKTQLNAKKPSPDTVAAIAWWESFEQSRGSRQIVTGEVMKECRNMVDVFHADKDCGPLLRMKGKREVSAFVKDPETGLLLKARFDLLPDGVNFIEDVKTARSTQPREWARDVAQFGYARQSAFYLHVANLLGLDRTEFLFLTIEKEVPYNPTPWQIGQESIAKGKAEIRRLLAEYKQCVETGIWPGYTSGGTQIFDAPKWYLEGKPFQEMVEYQLN